MAKGTRARKKDKTNEVSGLIAALKFISLAQRKEGTVYQRHCYIADRCIVASDGILSIGCKIEEEIKCCPATLTLLSTLQKCKDGLEIKEVTESRLELKSGAFRSIVPCVSAQEIINPINPDPGIGQIGPSLAKAFEVLGPLSTDSAQDVAYASILLRSGSALATNGHVAFEFWHGYNLPTVAIPKAAVEAVAGCGKTLCGFGYNEGRSITFFFDDDSWIKTQLFTDEWPDVDSILNRQSNAWPVPKGFFQGVDTLAPFSDAVFFGENDLHSHPNGTEGATFTVEGIAPGQIFANKYLKMIESLATRIDFTTYQNMLYFFGENIRGLILGRTI